MDKQNKKPLLSRYRDVPNDWLYDYCHLQWSECWGLFHYGLDGDEVHGPAWATVALEIPMYMAQVFYCHYYYRRRRKSNHRTIHETRELFYQWLAEE